MTTNNTFLRDDGQFVGPSAGGPRPVLTTATTYYVATNGNDANSGTSSGSPWLTFAHAMAVLTGQIDFGGQAVTLQAVAGHANFTSKLSVTPWVGGGRLLYDGGAGSIAVTNDRAIDIGGDAPNGGNGGPLTGSFAIQNVALSATRTTDVNAGRAINLLVPGFVFIKSGVSFGACGGHQIAALAGAAQVFIQADYSITGGGVTHWLIANGGLVFTQNAQTITLTGAPNFSGAFVIADEAKWSGGPFNFIGSATGQRFICQNNGIIQTGGQGPNYFPGNVAGTVSSGGQYT